ncbi:hypothetical protein NOVOSPHI9U_170004 [Novosphingobium sp. 9U]|nr:hypothetical protein NOVOSPHI9U_170004 [Novosphingobium sp. 9U]
MSNSLAILSPPNRGQLLAEPAILRRTREWQQSPSLSRSERLAKTSGALPSLLERIAEFEDLAGGLSDSNWVHSPARHLGQFLRYPSHVKARVRLWDEDSALSAALRRQATCFPG